MFVVWKNYFQDSFLLYCCCLAKHIKIIIINIKERKKEMYVHIYIYIYPHGRSLNAYLITLFASSCPVQPWLHSVHGFGERSFVRGEWMSVMLLSTLPCLPSAGRPDQYPGMIGVRPDMILGPR